MYIFFKLRGDYQVLSDKRKNLKYKQKIDY